MDKRMKEETKDTSSIANVIVSDEDAADGRQRSRLDEKFWGSFAQKIGIRLKMEGAAQPRMPASTYTFHLLFFVSPTTADVLLCIEPKCRGGRHGACKSCSIGHCQSPLLKVQSLMRCQGWWHSIFKWHVGIITKYGGLTEYTCECGVDG